MYGHLDHAYKLFWSEKSNEVNDFKLFSFRYVFALNIPLSLMEISTEITKTNYAEVKKYMNLDICALAQFSCFNDSEEYCRCTIIHI